MQQTEPGIVVQKAYDWSLWIIPKVEKFPKSYRFSIGQNLVASSLELLMNLVDATYQTRNSGSLSAAVRQVNRSRYLLRLAKDLRVLNIDGYEFGSKAMDEVGRMTGGWLKGRGAHPAVPVWTNCYSTCISQSMAFAPDILVTSPGEPQVKLVIQAKTSLPDLSRTEQELKRYMIGMQCPIGVLFTPQRLWLYRDFYTSQTPESVRRVGDYDAESLWRHTPPQQAAQFERFVQNWLEDLATAPASDLPLDLREALREYILPAVASGEVRAAHLRPS